MRGDSSSEYQDDILNLQNRFNLPFFVHGKWLAVSVADRIHPHTDEWEEQKFLKGLGDGGDC